MPDLSGLLPKSGKKGLIVKKYVSCDDEKCNRLHGPYLYLEWKLSGANYCARFGKSDKKYKQILLKKNKRKSTSVTELNHIEFMRIFSGGFCHRNGKYIPIEDYFETAKVEKRSVVWAARRVSSELIREIDEIEEQLSVGCNYFYFSHVVRTNAHRLAIEENKRQREAQDAIDLREKYLEAKRKGFFPRLPS